jgi:hypothetical protein
MIIYAETAPTELTQKISLLISVVDERRCYSVLLNLFTKLKKALESAN